MRATRISEVMAMMPKVYVGIDIEKTLGIIARAVKSVANAPRKDIRIDLVIDSVMVALTSLPSLDPIVRKTIEDLQRVLNVKDDADLSVLYAIAKLFKSFGINEVSLFVSSFCYAVNELDNRSVIESMAITSLAPLIAEALDPSIASTAEATIVSNLYKLSAPQKIVVLHVLGASMVNAIMQNRFGIELQHPQCINIAILADMVDALGRGYESPRNQGSRS